MSRSARATLKPLRAPELSLSTLRRARAQSRTTTISPAGISTSPVEVSNWQPLTCSKSRMRACLRFRQRFTSTSRSPASRWSASRL